MGKYQGYEKYKDSGVEWLGEIPQSWNIIPFKFLIETRKGVAFKSSDFTDIGCRVVKASDIKNYSILESDTYLDSSFKKEYPKAVLRAGEIVLSTVGSTPDVKNSAVGQVGIVPKSLDQCLLNQNTVILNPNSKYILNKYLFYILISNRYRDHLDLHAHGTANQASLNISDMLSFQSPIPPLEEQSAIAQFLDHKTSQIDALISKKEALLEKLDEKRTALISHAVTKGLDPTVPMKDSGIQWLGEIPEHWEVKRLKFVVNQIIDAEHKTAPYDEEGDYLVVRTTNVRGGKLLLEGAKFTTETVYKEWTVRAVPEEGDILFTREAPAGEGCLVPEKPILCLGQRMVLLKFNKGKYDGFFLLQSLYSGIADEFIKSLSLGSTVAHFNMSDIGSIPLFIPPYQEQKEIALYLNKKTNYFDKQIQKVQTGIDLLKEYRTALITNAVTGKIDVRQVPIPQP